MEIIAMGIWDAYRTSCNHRLAAMDDQDGGEKDKERELHDLAALRPGPGG
jgi:hypothetical protein